MSNANRMVPRPGREPTGPKKLEEIRLPTEEEEVKKGLLDKILLDTIVEPEDALSLSEIEVIELKQTIRTKSLEILQRKAGLLAKLKEIIDHETLLQSLDSYFTEMTEAINNLVSEVYNNRKILGREATEELIEEILNLLYFDPEKDGDLINKLEAKLAKLSQNSYQLEKPLNLFPRDQLALISDEGNKLEQFKERVQAALERNNYEELKGLVEEISDKLRRSAYYQAILISEGRNKLEQFKERVQAALERNNYEELKGLVEEISALKIMQVYPSRSSPFPSEREAWKLIFEYHLLKRVLYYQIILSSEGGNTLEQFRRRVQAALESNDEKELESLAQEISALKIMQVYLSPSSPFSSEIQAYELRVEYDKLKRVLYYQIILITEGGNTLEQFRRRVQAALESNDEKELESLAQEISALKIMQVYPSRLSPLISEREAYELRVEYDKLNYQAILITEGGNTLEQFRRRVQAALESNDEKELESLAQEISALKIMQVFPISSSRVLSEREAYELKAEYQRMIEMIKEAQRRLRKLGPST